MVCGLCSQWEKTLDVGERSVKRETQVPLDSWMLHVHRKQDSAPPSPRAHGDLAGPPRDQTQHQESVSTCSSGPGQAAGMATWSQDGVSAVISISRDKEPCGFETGVNPRNRTSSDPWIVVVKERPRRTAAPRAQLVLRPPLQWPPDKLCKCELQKTTRHGKFNKHLTLHFPQIQSGEINI